MGLIAHKSFTFEDLNSKQSRGVYHSYQEGPETQLMHPNWWPSMKGGLSWAQISQSFPCEQSRWQTRRKLLGADIAAAQRSWSFFLVYSSNLESNNQGRRCCIVANGLYKGMSMRWIGGVIGRDSGGRKSECIILLYHY